MGAVEPGAQPQIQPDTVEALVDHVRDLLRTEDGREQSLNARGTALAAFAGLLMTLAAAVAAPTFERHVARWWKLAAILLLAGVLIALLATIGLAIFGVLRPRVTLAFSIREVRDYRTRRVVTKERVQIQGHVLHGLVDVLAVERDRVSRKTAHLNRAYNFLGVAMMLFAALWLILGLHAERLV
jgi:zinc transporter ZupT